ncbi:hypothetical protein [Sulfitobacter sediminilitoris]|uniref:hypothetical protein n=1 Tax=Sulfitobacter sediminilitoris TaxID=2698830 RepID=UPI003622EAC8
MLHTGSEDTELPKQKMPDHLVHNERHKLEQSREKSRTARQTVQMSIRMEEGAYLQFKAMCTACRETNGDMVQYLMEFYLRAK